MSEERSPVNSGIGRLNIEPAILASMREHAERAYPEEACGGLLGALDDEGTTVVHATVPLANARRDERRRRYLIGPEDVLELERRAEAARLEVVGYYHSHPDAPAVPSRFDREHAWPWYVYVIVSVEAGQVVDARAWRLADDRQRFEPLGLSDEPASRTEADDR